MALASVGKMAGLTRRNFAGEDRHALSEAQAGHGELRLGIDATMLASLDLNSVLGTLPDDGRGSPQKRGGYGFAALPGITRAVGWAAVKSQISETHTP